MATGKLLKIGSKLPAAAGQDCVVEKFIGAGGQGEVYQVKIGRERLALKWYFEQNQQVALKKSLDDLIARKAPSSRFLWPQQVIAHKGQFGYVMSLRPMDYQKSQKLLDRSFSLSYRTAATACLQLADGFRKLHMPGLSYQDISWGNLFIKSDTGDILICDNDNVAPHGSQAVVVSGTYGFMAPEVVLGKRKPDQYTDLFSLAVLMFRILFLEHPFHGRRWANIACWDDFAKRRLYGEDPLFIFDPKNRDNRPEPGVQDNANTFWRMYPTYVRDGFVKVFTQGLKDRENGRLHEEEWIEIFRRLRESVFPCPLCGRDVLFDQAAAQISCWHPRCKGYNKALQLPARLKIKSGNRERMIPLNTNTRLLNYQLMPREYDLDKGDTPAGEMTQNPTDPTKWGIRNLTKENWQVTLPNGTVSDVAPGKALGLVTGLKVDFKSAVAEIVV